ncbi:hypothetical protein ABTM60_20110, partial [Acinetobacter baumannii]
VDGGNKASTTAASLYVNTRLISIVLLLAVIAVGAGAAIAVTTSVIRQIGGDPDYAQAVVRQVADGDIDVNVATRPGDTTSLLAAL